MTEHFDAIVVGAAQAGPSLAVRLAEAGERVALFERRGLGGTCGNDGCVPSKTMISQAVHPHPTVGEPVPATLLSLEPLA